MATYQIRAGDTITMDPSTLTNRVGATIDLTGSTCRFQADDWLGVNVIDQLATIANPTNPASLKYTFQVADTTRKGQFRARWHVVYAGGAIETFPTAPTDLTLVIY